MMLPCLTLTIIKYVSRVKWRKGVAPSPTPVQKGAFGLLSTRVVNFIYIYIYIYHHHHHHVVLVARISLTLSRHFSLSFITSGLSSGQHPVSSHSCWMYVRAGRPAFARPWVIIRVLVVTKSLCGYVLNQVPYNMESARYLG